ncbi:hypothetical protein KY331_00240 [Candidatus Woesearchaeota archaeon]|nr:hypothetical protein [Candidatus Woesearchaeota archaeon]
MKYKKSQAAATSAATLIAIIAGLIVLYLLVLPPGEREKILGENITEEGEEAKVKETKTLLSINPGRLDYLAQREIEHIIPSVNLNIITEAEVLKEINSIYIKRGLFTEEKGNISFRIEDIENTENVLLNFVATQRTGRLTIKLNGRVIFNNEIQTVNIEPIKLKEYLENFNVLEFTVNSPPATNFWKTNEYLLENIMITADLVRRGAQESKNIFIISSVERNNLEKAILRFLPECITGLVGTLDVWVNNYNIFSAVPDCGALSRPIEIPDYYLVSGENRLIFRTSKGNYLIDQIKIKSELEQLVYPVYYFEITDKRHQRIQDDEANVTLSLRFVDDIERKRARIIVNGHMISLDQNEIKFKEEITRWVEKGNNAIKIEPQKTIDVVELEVVYKTE